jgi:hypothetical protein
VIATHRVGRLVGPSCAERYGTERAARYSTVTLLARFLGLSTSVPRATAV